VTSQSGEPVDKIIFHRVSEPLVGIWLIASQTIDAPLVASLVGVAIACGTAAYGVYMLRVKRAILATLAESDPGAAPAR
jgi:hypothetical protein